MLERGGPRGQLPRDAEEAGRVVRDLAVFFTLICNF